MDAFGEHRLQIYQDDFRDLLVPPDERRRPIHLREEQGSVMLHGVSECPVSWEDDVESL